MAVCLVCCCYDYVNPACAGRLLTSLVEGMHIERLHEETVYMERAYKVRLHKETIHIERVHKERVHKHWSQYFKKQTWVGGGEPDVQGGGAHLHVTSLIYQHSLPWPRIQYPQLAHPRYRILQCSLLCIVRIINSTAAYRKLETTRINIWCQRMQWAM